MRLGVPHFESSGWIAGAIYVRNLAAALHLLPPSERPEVVFLAGPRRTRSTIKGARGRGLNMLTYGYYDGRNPVWAGVSALASLGKGGSVLSLGHTAQRADIDLLFPIAHVLPNGMGVPWIGWVPDYQYMCLPELWANGQKYVRDMESLSTGSPYLVVSSEDARKHAERFFGRTRNIRALPFALVVTDEWYEKTPEQVAARYGLPDRFLVFPSQFWKHKDHETLIRAVALLRERGRRDVVLVLTGWPHDTRDPAHGPNVLRLIGALGLEDQVRILGLIERPEVIALMRRAVAIVQPSRFEGWSTLVEEARSLGKPIVLSDLDVHKEQKPPHARFFAVSDAEALAEAILAMWDDGAPGPDAERERAARALANERAIAFARKFVATAHEAIMVFGRG